MGESYEVRAGYLPKFLAKISIYMNNFLLGKTALLEAPVFLQSQVTSLLIHQSYLFRKTPARKLMSESNYFGSFSDITWISTRALALGSGQRAMGQYAMPI